MIDFPLPHEPLGDPERKGRMTLKEAAKEAVRANRAHDWDAFDRAMARLEALTSDDAPPPVDLAEMMKGILLDPYKRGR